MRNWGPVSPKLARLWHGGDYNPDQWLHEPAVLAEDVRLMRLAGCNTMSVGVFAWAALEPEEGRYEFGWLDGVVERLAAAGIFTVLATPSGARPAWMAEKYPEVLRVAADGRRALFGTRHNHCFTSPVYRAKVREMNGRLADRYGRHPNVLLWHLSNEYGGECHCDLCQEAFRAWLRCRYRDDLDAANRAWWTSFWSHTLTSWTQVHSPAPHGEHLVHGLNLDWRRFVTDQTVDFMRAEIAPLKAAAPELPVTTNLMGTSPGLDYWKLAPHLDVVSWDNYPAWHGIGSIPDGRGAWDPEGRDWRLASDIGFVHDLNRSLKAGRPFLLMESTPSVTNWHSVARLKRPGMHLLSSLQAVAHGSDSVQYFQWRKGRGGSEKFHGAVVDHAGTERTRVFAGVAEVGRVLARLDEVVGTSTGAPVAVVFDWENRWAIEDSQGPLNDGRTRYERTCKDHYQAFWTRGIAVDVIDEDQPLEGYRLVATPMAYLVKPGFAERLERFVEEGGTLVCTYWSGIADEHDLCFLGGFPGPLRKLLGIWAEEIDALYPEQRNAIVMERRNQLGLSGSYEVRDLCDLVHLETAEAVAVYEGDFYAGRPAVTVNRFGKGKAWYLAARTEERFLADFYGALAAGLEIPRAVGPDLPEGVSARVRGDDRNTFLFVMNFAPDQRRVDLGDGAAPLPGDPGWADAVTGEAAPARFTLPGYGVRVLRRPAG
jgi:beta-galactosidase